MSLYKNKTSQYWFVRISLNGQRIRRSTGTANKTEARRIHDEIKAGLWEQQESGLKKIACYTWQDAVIAWLKNQPRGLPDRYRLRSFSLPLDSDLGSITPADIIPHLPKTSPATYNRMVALVLAILNHAKTEDLISFVPVLKKKKVNESRIRWLTLDEWERLEKELPDHLKAMAGFALATGLRKANVTGLVTNMRRWGSSVGVVKVTSAVPSKNSRICSIELSFESFILITIVLQ